MNLLNNYEPDRDFIDSRQLSDINEARDVRGAANEIASTYRDG